jgi:transposase
MNISKTNILKIKKDKIKPLKIKRNRDKTFTTKRNNYKSYHNAKWTWTEILNELDNIKNKEKNFIKVISLKYNIVYSTLKHKYNDYKNNKINNINEENRGGHNKKINEEQEKILYQYVKLNYIDTEDVLNNNIIKQIVKEKNKISVSDWWISNFKKKWKLSTQKVKPSKIAVNLPTENEQKIFLNECNEYETKVKKKFFSTTMKHIIIL